MLKTEERGMTTAVAVYERPSVMLEGRDLEEESWLWFAVIIGFSFALALAYAAYCTANHGYPVISFGWSGFKVACYK